ncbi:MAG TPA: GcrA family cell cycle regulator [Xanthobacteraceae bacterium]|nr:GcrA family cell cycle regulator [Xanthobacteraceae bacterium]
MPDHGKANAIRSAIARAKGEGAPLDPDAIARATGARREYVLQLLSQAGCPVHHTPWDARLSWTRERIEQLRTLHQRGLSASQIAARLGGVTRNAVIGKLHRMGLAQNTAASRSQRSRPNRCVRKRMPPRPLQSPRRRILALLPAASRAAPMEIEVPPGARRQLADIAANNCRWIIGDPREAAHHFCHQVQVPGLPYCEFHARKAYQLAPAARPCAEAVAATATETVEVA